MFKLKVKTKLKPTALKVKQQTTTKLLKLYSQVWATCNDVYKQASMYYSLYYLWTHVIININSISWLMCDVIYALTPFVFREIIERDLWLLILFII